MKSPIKNKPLPLREAFSGALLFLISRTIPAPNATLRMGGSGQPTTSTHQSD